MTLKEFLIGAQLKDINDDGMTLVKDTKELFLLFETDDGDCCGYATIDSNLYLDSLENMPIITNVEIIDNDDDGDNSKGEIVLFGLDKLIAKVEAVAGSGSGWCYGAVARVTCSLYGIDEVLASW